MQRTSDRGQVLVASSLAIALIAITAVLSFVLIGDGTSPSGPTPTASPSNPPVATPSVDPSVEPTAPVVGPVEVELDIVTEHHVAVLVDDRTGSVTNVSSGAAGDGMSVRWFDVWVEQIDRTTIRVTWVGLPVDEVIDLVISQDGAKFALDFVQAGPPADSDAIGFDRVLVIEFDHPVDDDDVEVWFPAPVAV